MNNTHQDILSQASQLRQEGEYAQAIELCQKILISDLTCSQAYEELGDNYLSLQDYPAAEKTLTRCLQLEPENANANYLLGFTYSEQNNWEKAIHFFEIANNLRQNHPEILRCLGWTYFHARSPRQGLALLERARTLAPDDILILLDLGTCLFASRRQTQAKECFEHILTIEPNNEKALQHLKQIHKLSRAKK